MTPDLLQLLKTLPTSYHIQISPSLLKKAENIPQYQQQQRADFIPTPKDWVIVSMPLPCINQQP